MFIEDFPILFNISFVIGLIVFEGFVLFIFSKSLKLSNARLGTALGVVAVSFVLTSALVAVLGLVTDRFYVGGVPWVVSTLLRLMILVLAIRWRYEATLRNAFLTAVSIVIISELVWNFGWYMIGQSAFEV